jgi:hypothetical protein
LANSGICEFGGTVKQGNPLLATRFFVRARVMGRENPKKSSPPSQPSSDDSGSGGRSYHGRVAAVAWMKRSEIQKRSISFNVAPGFHFVPSGLRRKRRRNAVRRCSVTSALSRGAAPTFILPRSRRRTQEGAARLPAFHCGSCPRDSRIPRTQLRTRLRGAQHPAGLSRRRQLRLQRAPRAPVMVPVGMMSDAAREQR